MINQFKNPTFGGFKPDAMQRIAGTLGYTGDMSGFNSYLDQNPDKKNQMEQFKQAAMTMAKGGSVRKFNTGGFSFGNTPVGNLPQGNTGYSANPAQTAAERQAAATAQQMAANNNDDSPADFSQGIQTLQGPTSEDNTTYYKVGDSTFQDYQSALHHYNTSGGAQTDMPIGDVVGGPALPPPSFGGPPLTKPDPIVTLPVMPDLGGYDPTKGMPEALPEPDFSVYGYVLPDYAEGPLKDIVMGGTDLGNIKIEGNTVTFSDGKTIQAQTPEQAQMIVDAATQYKIEVQNPQKLKEDAYRNYITQQIGSGVTGDIENIDQVYADTSALYEQQNIELQRLQAQSAANPNDPYLKELVEAKGKEVSDTYGKLQQITPLYQSRQKTISDVMTERATDPTLPEGAKVDAALIGEATEGQLIEAGSGQVSGDGGVSSVALADTYLAANVDQPDTAKYEADVRADQVAAQTQALNAAQTNEDDARAQVSAAMATASMVGDLNAAQGTATLMENEVQREIQDGELVSGASTDATKAAKFTEQVEAATATPSEKATVQGQLVGLMEQFEGTTPPAWASGAVRLANQQMAARGLGASSMAGQAIIQAAMESALPIAQADASTQASFEAQNLSNVQARRMLAAEQRAQFLGQEFDQDFQSRVLNAGKVSDVANMNFTADQQIQLENARMVQTMNLENLSNRQGMLLAEASALANLDMGNLNNRQQTSVQNAQNFLQMDMANLSNEQQVEVFKSQQIIQSMLTDQAAVNASRQFNATSENQANQFYDNLNSTINTFNAEQSNVQERANAGMINTANQFNAEMKNQREQFNASNQLVVDQSNATWRREIATQDTAATNRANELNAINTLDVSNTAYNNMWQLYGDQMEWAWTSAENQQDRINELAQEQLSVEERKLMIDAESSRSFGNLVSNLLFSDLSKTFAGSFFSGLG